MSEIIYTRGLPASGKSTWAREKAQDPKFKRVNNDDLRLMFDGVRFDEANEKFIGEARRVLCQRVVEAGYSLVIDNCNLSPKAVAEIETLGRRFGIAPACEDFTHVPLETCIERDAARGENAVGRAVIQRMHDQFLAKKSESKHAMREYGPVINDVTKRPTAIFDVDGTLANHNGIRGHYELDKVHLDEPHHDIVGLTNMMGNGGFSVILVSGRENTARCGRETKAWLDRAGVAWDELHMRREGDYRADDIIKREILEQDILPFYYVAYVFDDRDRVVSMWRQSGLRCLQVAEGNF